LFDLCFAIRKTIRIVVLQEGEGAFIYNCNARLLCQNCIGKAVDLADIKRKFIYDHDLLFDLCFAIRTKIQIVVLKESKVFENGAFFWNCNKRSPC
jgi:hypothetical protein